jgi:hypothetical protein
MRKMNSLLPQYVTETMLGNVHKKGIFEPMRRKAAFIGLVGGAALFVSGCVTINIYFPASSVEKAADKIIEEVYQLKKGEASKDAPKDAAKDAPKDAAKGAADKK